LAGPHRAIRFGLFNAEEQGRIGSIHYASDQRLAGAPILAVYCMDMIGFNGVPERDFEVHFGLASNREVQERSRPLAELLEQIRPLVSPELAPVEVHPGTPDAADGADHRSDHSSFQDAGFAACLVSENFFPTPGRPVTDSNPNYHRFGDRLDQLDLAYAADIARTVTAAVWLAARA
jgi:bacterial leucyl aminopeptidase